MHLLVIDGNDSTIFREEQQTNSIPAQTVVSDEQKKQLAGVSVT